MEIKFIKLRLFYFTSGLDNSDAANTSVGEELSWNQACRCSLWISMVEVYNENIIDLLAPSKTHTKVGVATDPEARFYLQGKIPTSNYISLR